MNKRTDRNQPEIVAQLRKLGWSCSSIASVGNGVPDILVGVRKTNYVFEIKDPLQPPSKRKLTPDEIKWHQSWQGQVHIVESIDDILKVINDK